jgi:hypothetical protein
MEFQNMRVYVDTVILPQYLKPSKMGDFKMPAFKFMGILENVLRKSKLYISPVN